MSRFSGKIGYGESLEEPLDSGVWVDVITEFPYFGDVVTKQSRRRDSEYLNRNIEIGNSISIVADQYANKHFSKIVYVVWEGTRWSVDSVTVQPPRLILDLGEVYNGPLPPGEEES